MNCSGTTSCPLATQRLIAPLKDSWGLSNPHLFSVDKSTWPALSATCVLKGILQEALYANNMQHALPFVAQHCSSSFGYCQLLKIYSCCVADCSLQKAIC